MASILKFPPQPKVLNVAFVRQLAESNRAVRQIRTFDCRVLEQSVSERGSTLVIDRNPHRTLSGCPTVHVIFRGVR